MFRAVDAVVIVSCRFEWQATLELFPDAYIERTPFGEAFEAAPGGKPGLFFQGGWGKISAAASAQYAIGRWKPRLLVNLGTCGGFAGEIARGEVILAERTVVYDIIEQMTDPEAAIEHYSTCLDLSWLKGAPPQPVRRAILVSADRDLLACEMAGLKARFGAVAGDWESGAIAWVAARNGVRAVILRGVSDLVGEHGGEAYGAIDVYAAGAQRVMHGLIAHLPAWIKLALP